jgi:hypothetical protein
MSFNGRPSNPPFALVSSIHICVASSDTLPVPASPPVSAMPMPMVIGSFSATAAPNANRDASKIAASRIIPRISPSPLAPFLGLPAA